MLSRMCAALALCALAWTAAAAPADTYSPEANSAPFEQPGVQAPAAPPAPEAKPVEAAVTPPAPEAKPAESPATGAQDANPAYWAKMRDDIGAEIDKSAASATAVAPATGKELEKPSAARTLLQAAYALVIVLALIFAAYFALMRIRRHAPMLGGGEFASVVGRLHLDPRFALHFVRVGDKVLLLGVTPQSVNILEAFDAATFNLERAQAAPEVESQHDFMAHLRASTQALNPLTPGPADDEEIVSLRGDIERLKRYLEEGPRVDPEH